MRNLYLPYVKVFDKETTTWCLTGRDSRRRDFGVAAAESVEKAEERLRNWVLDSLLAAADDGEDRLRDLYVRCPAEARCVMLGPRDLLPIRIRLLRVRHGLSQAAMAERLGITQQAYAKLERPGSNPGLDTLVRVERALNDSVLEYASWLSFGRVTEERDVFIEPHTLENLATSLSDGSLAFQVQRLAALPRAAIVVEGDYSDLFRTQPGRGSWLADMLGRLAVRYPEVPVVFAGSRKFAEEWAYRFFGAAVADHIESS